MKGPVYGMCVESDNNKLSIPPAVVPGISVDPPTPELNAKSSSPRKKVTHANVKMALTASQIVLTKLQKICCSDHGYDCPNSPNYYTDLHFLWLSAASVRYRGFYGRLSALIIPSDLPHALLKPEVLDLVGP